jgi:hypothetical protein
VTRSNFSEEAREVVYDHIMNEREPAGFHISDVYVVWFCYILGGWKALVSTTIKDNCYYEITYNVKKDELYLDQYKKVNNVTYPNFSGEEAE